MKDSGVIFISIDINELAQLKLLCDDIFGESNLVSLISIKVKDAAVLGQQSFIFDVCEYVLMYAKNIKNIRTIHQELPMDYEILTKQYGSYNKVILDFGKKKFLKEISRPNIGPMKIYRCEDYSINKTKNFTLKEYAKNSNKIYDDYNRGGKLVENYA